jgi:hypothetical protein
VPVQRRKIDRSEIGGSELAFRCLEQHPDPDADADQHVKAVQAGHEEIDAKKHVRHARPGDVRARIERTRSHQACRQQRFELFFRGTLDRLGVPFGGRCGTRTGRCSAGTGRRLLLVQLGQLLGVLGRFRVLVPEGLQLPDLLFGLEVFTGQKSIVVLVRVLHVFHAHERERAGDGDDDVDHQQLLLGQLRVAHRPGGSQAGEEQHAGVDRAQLGIQEVVRVNEHLRVHRAVHGVRAEQPGEEQDFSQQEQPDAELAGVELLLRRIEVMR